MKLSILICVCLVLLYVTDAGKPKKTRKAKRAKKNVVDAISDTPDVGVDVEANLTALWKEVRSWENGVQIHVHGMGDTETHMDNNSLGTHIHLHMHLDTDSYHGGRHSGHHMRHESSEEKGYHYAVCRVQPNSALPADEQPTISGNVFFRQLHGEHLEIKVHLEGFATSGDHAKHVHGVHVHEFGDMSDGCQSMGGHFNPDNKEHGGPDSETRHCGDYGNIECDAMGVSHKTFNDHHTALEGHYSVMGRGLVIHENADDLGTENDASGGVGGRIACCVIVGSTEVDWDKIHGEHTAHIVPEDNDHDGHHGMHYSHDMKMEHTGGHENHKMHRMHHAHQMHNMHENHKEDKAQKHKQHKH